MIKNEAYVLWFYFLGMVKQFLELHCKKILVFGNNLPVALLEFVGCQEHLAYGEKKN